MGILIQYTISKFSKTKNKTLKRPPKDQKIENNIRRPQMKKFYKTGPPQKWEF